MFFVEYMIFKKFDFKFCVKLLIINFSQSFSQSFAKFSTKIIQEPLFISNNYSENINYKVIKLVKILYL